MFDLKPVDNIQILVLPIKVFSEVCQGEKFRTCCDLVQRTGWRRKIKVELLTNLIDFSPLS